jgi:hypothetical protein
MSTILHIDVCIVSLPSDAGAIGRNTKYGQDSEKQWRRSRHAIVGHHHSSIIEEVMEYAFV